MSAYSAASIEQYVVSNDRVHDTDDEPRHMERFARYRDPIVQAAPKAYVSSDQHVEQYAILADDEHDSDDEPRHTDRFARYSDPNWIPVIYTEEEQAIINAYKREVKAWFLFKKHFEISDKDAHTLIKISEDVVINVAKYAIRGHRSRIVVCMLSGDKVGHHVYFSMYYESGILAFTLDGVVGTMRIKL